MCLSILSRFWDIQSRIMVCPISDLQGHFGYFMSEMNILYFCSLSIIDVKLWTAINQSQLAVIRNREKSNPAAVSTNYETADDECHAFGRQSLAWRWSVPPFPVCIWFGVICAGGIAKFVMITSGRYAPKSHFVRIGSGSGDMGEIADFCFTFSLVLVYRSDFLTDFHAQ